MATPQPIALTGLYTIAAGAANLEDNLPARAYPYNIAWAIDRTPDAGYMVSNGTTWTSNAGPPGTSGNTILSGTGAPSGGLGNNGDFYVDVVASRMYGPKTAGIWGSGTALIGPQGPAGPSSIGTPNTRTVAFATAYQASNTAKPAFVSIVIDCTTTVSIGTPQANTAELIIGSTNAVASGTGTLADTYRSDLSVTLISLGFTGRQALQASIPAGWYFAVRRTVGTGMTIVSAFDQAIG